VIALLAYKDPATSPVGTYMDLGRREQLAQRVSAAILRTGARLAKILSCFFILMSTTSTRLPTAVQATSERGRTRCWIAWCDSWLSLPTRFERPAGPKAVAAVPWYIY